MLPALLRTVGSSLLRSEAVSAGANRLVVASRLNKVAGNKLVQGLAKHSGASKVPALDKIGSYLSKVPSGKEKEKKERGTSTSSSSKNRDKARDDAAKNQERQDKAEKESLGVQEENASLLKVIAKDTVRVRDAVEALAKNGVGGGAGGDGMMDKLLKTITSLPALLPSLLTGPAGKLGGFVTKFASKIPGVGRLMGSIGGMGKAGEAATTVARAGVAAEATAARAGAAAVGRHALRDPKTGRFIARSAVQAAEVAPKGILAKAGAAAAGVGGAKIAGKATGAIGKGIAKTAGKSLLKKIPIIGAIAGLGLAANRAYAGDWTGAGLEAASGLAGTIPGIGTAASLGLDAAILARDLKNDGSSTPAVTAAAKPVTASKPPVHTAAIAAAPVVAQRKTAAATDSMQVTMAKMLDVMTDRSKGIYIVPAEVGASTLQTRSPYNPQGVPTGNKYEPIVSASPYDSAPSSIGPATAGRTMGEGTSVTSGQTMRGGRVEIGPTGNFERDLLNQIAAGEAGKEGYDSVWSGSRVKPTKPVSQMTFGEVMQWQRDTLNEQKSRGIPANRRSSAVGRYQFISSTLKAQMAAAGFKEDDLFNTENQDKLALTLMNQGGNLDKFKSGRISAEKFQDYIASQWASQKTASGAGMYNAAGFNHAGHSSLGFLKAAQASGSLTASSGSPTAMVRDAAQQKQAARMAPIVVSAPTQVVQNGQKEAAAPRTTASATPVIVRNPDSPVRSYVLSQIRTS
ncbi:hypothetical protein [Xanthomonas phage X1]|nr:hypothetical protein [Xanthomonas phage X1]